MKNSLVTAFVFTSFFGSIAMAHDIHNVASDHTHSNNLVYTHSVSSAYDHHQAHDNTSQYNNYGHYYRTPQVTTNTATYYTRSYPVSSTYTYTTTPNTTIHYPPFAYSSCANNCNQTSERITVTKKLNTNTKTYRAPSEYSAQESYMVTPRKSPYNCTNQTAHSTTYVSPYKTHKLTTATCYGCGY